MRATLLALAAVVLAASAAGAAPRDPVGDALNACLDRSESQSTAGMQGCLTAAIADYDRLLEKTFQAVVKALDPDSRELVRTAQRQWLAFRHAEEVAQQGAWRDSRGAVIRVATLSSNVDLVRQRIEQLSLYLPN